MLRIVFLLLLLGNAGYYMWSHGYLAGMGLAPELQSEPQRLQEQIRPDSLVLQQPEAAQAPATEPAKTAEPEPEAPAVDDSAPPAAPESKSDGKPEAVTAAARESKDGKDTKDAKTAIKEPEACYQASGIEEAQADSIRRALAGKSKSDWELVASHQGGRWMVYMGKFPDAEFMDRKRGELRLMNIDFDRAGGSFEPGLSLGRFSTEEAAQRQLATFARQGVRTARVVQERPDVTTYALRLPKATRTLRNEVAALAGKNLLPKALQACAK
ncbi:SPOR domain-containing protein [Comamonas sp. C11]|uniref:SPOR domain-containing protein n=1 Tax=Comamonas sp. C11 TaxID=2966554 RepID=UPI002111399D|nr:SPOR domain-containing protein [Comamonas sp. C11]UUC93765.1 SPOR domain-containing protein [Comamonas sp. C11]